MMKAFVFAALLAVTLAFVPIDHQSFVKNLTGKALVDYVNSAQSLFITEHVDVSEEFMKSRVMNIKYASPPPSDKIRATEVNTVLAIIPETFDARIKWPKCKSIKLIRNQANCGSCWAFGAGEVISDRICIATKGARQPIISPMDMVDCCGEYCDYGCDGGYSIQALTIRWWVSDGVVTGGDYQGDGCKPYQFCNSAGCPDAVTPECALSCQSKYNTEYAKDKNFAYYVGMTVGAIQTEIMTNGPVEASFKVYEDFYKYKSGVYKYTAGKMLGGHAIKIIGWGTENGTAYWLIANSWGTKWGENGFFKIRRGVNECGIERNVVAGKAKLDTL
ncbi:hypothetical protein B9Z55_018407 [Caenorhabditis nigoni]|uniref:Peptidase C1A papain C-terminal domain-containing protein n=2 Tax=Caenorhabditis nigoni TaxID=1611254 RepID=A0A2G5TE25_9PELO|nr:hypothetical protein B9Z55_018407 [Caenorhabditis nigoni]